MQAFVKMKINFIEISAESRNFASWYEIATTRRKVQ